MNDIGYVEWMEAAAYSDCSVTLAFAGVIALAGVRKPPYDVPIAGLDTQALAALVRRYFPALRVAPTASSAIGQDGLRDDLFDDLVALLLEHKRVDDDETKWLAHAIATACMGENHLWQDIYRELCARADVLICKSPSCGECVDYAVCFEPAEMALPVVLPIERRRARA